MGKLTRLAYVFNTLTGINARHNRALRDVLDWVVQAEDTLSGYGVLEEAAGLARLVEKAGEAKLDLTSLAYHGQPLLKTARAIRGAEVQPLLGEAVEGLEEIRRALIDPSLNRPRLEQQTQHLRQAFSNLRNTLSAVEYR